MILSLIIYFRLADKKKQNVTTKKSNKENGKKDSPTEDSSQHLFKERSPRISPPIIDKSFSEIRDNFLVPSTKKLSPKSKPLKQAKLTEFSKSINDSDATFCELIETRRKPSSSWLSKSKTSNSLDSRKKSPTDLSKSFTGIAVNHSKVEKRKQVDDLFDFKKPRIKPIETLVDPDETPDISQFNIARIKVKQEVHSESDVDLFESDLDESSRDSVIIIDNTEKPITVEDSGDMGDSSLASLHRRIENISEYNSMDGIESEESEEVVPLFRQGVRYKDCQECHLYYKQKMIAKEICNEVRPCKVKCQGHLSRVRDVKNAKAPPPIFKSPPRRANMDDTPEGIWDLNFQTDN